jgi:predicted nucleic acid-binding Zn ribbon protein
MKPLRGTLEKIAADLLRHAPAEEAPLLAWQIVSGQAVAGRTKPLGYAEGTLRIEVPDRAWMSQLQALAPQYLESYRQMVSTPVKRIEFVLAAGQ